MPVLPVAVWRKNIGTGANFSVIVISRHAVNITQLIKTIDTSNSTHEN